MARPKLGDGETERLHMKITADEIKAIDDWRYSNRVPSRSEAVRRMVQIALSVDAKMPGLVEAYASAIDEYEKSAQKVLQALQHKDGNDLSEFISAVGGMLQKVGDGFGEIASAIKPIEKARVSMKTEGGFDDALVAKRMSEVQDIVEPLEKLLSDYERTNPKGDER